MICKQTFSYVYYGDKKAQLVDALSTVFRLSSNPGLLLN